jgi:hypothetical protein
MNKQKNKCVCVPIQKATERAAYKPGVSVAANKYQTTHREQTRKIVGHSIYM